MKTKLTRIPPVLVILFACAGTVLSEPAVNTTVSGDVCENLDRYIEKMLERLNIPGAVLAVVQGDVVVHMKGFCSAGIGGGGPSPQTPFVIGSLTKSVTALGVMQLVEAGEVELDAPVKRYLTWFEVANTGDSATESLARDSAATEPADSGPSAQITVRHLLQQTSGFSQVSGMRRLANFDTSPDACENQARKLVPFTPVRSPGVSYEYSNMNYNLLGLIIEAVSGEPYDDYIERNIFTPLDMRHSHTSKDEAVEDGLAVGHRLWFGIPKAVPNLPLPKGSLPSGQLISSAEDMARYLIAHLNGGRFGGSRLLSPGGIKELHRPGVDAGAMGIDMGEYAMGWFVEETEHGRLLWHDGTTPDYFSYMALFPKKKAGMVLLCNGNQMMVNFALLENCMTAAELLAGSPIDAEPSARIVWILRSFFIIPVLMLAGVLVTLRTTRRWRFEDRRRPGPLKKWGYYILLGSLPYLILVVSAIALTASGLFKFILLFMPDITWLLLVCGGLSLIWVALRTRLIISVLKPVSSSYE